MTGFIQRMLTRGTGKPQQANQVTFQPRPRSRFEAAGGPGQESGLNEQADEFSAKETDTPASNSPLAQTSRPARSPSIEQAGPMEHAPDGSMFESPDRSVTTQPEVSQPGTVHPQSVAETLSHQQEKQVPPQAAAPEQILKEKTVEVVRERPASSPASTQTRDAAVTQNMEAVPGESVREVFRERVMETRLSSKTQVDAGEATQQSASHSEVVSHDDIESSSPRQDDSPEVVAENEKPTVREIVTRHTPDLTPARENSSQPATDAPQSGAAPEVNISIGRITVEFTQPETRMNPRARPPIQRTSGFDNYAQARRGMRRR